jgi:hypothetical protein
MEMFEKILTNLDVGPSGAAWRVALGLGLVPLVHAAFRGGDLPRAALALGALLFLLKLFAAVARRLVPATPAVRAHWEWRRELARHHDAYQWRKLIWVGAGVLAGGAALPRAGWEWPLGAACVAAGAVAEAIWRREGLGIAPPLPGVSP